MGNENEEDLSLTLQQHRVDIVRSIDTERQFIICYLQSKLALDGDDCERISSCTTRQDRAAKLLDILLLKGPDALAHFIASLEIDYPKLYEKITGKKADARKFCNTFVTKCCTHRCIIHAQSYERILFLLFQSNGTVQSIQQDTCFSRTC